MDMLIIALVAVAAMLVFALVYQERQHYQEKRELLDRLMARSIEEFKYYQQAFPKEVAKAEELTEAEIREKDERTKKIRELGLDAKGF